MPQQDNQQPVVADPTTVTPVEPTAVPTPVDAQSPATITETPAPVAAETTTEVSAQVGPAPVDMGVVSSAPATITETPAPVMNTEPVNETVVPQEQPVQATPVQ